MPNTLCHIGIQLPLTSAVYRRQLLLWAIVACILPDLPWINLSLLLNTGWFDPYDLRLYTTIQASLFFTLMLCGTLAVFSSTPGKVFVLLGTNCLLHLLLDSLQIKWGNGVNLLAPFDWQMLQLDFSWPETLITLFFTCAGFYWLLFSWNKLRSDPPPLRPPGRKGVAIAFLCLFSYALGPLCFLSAAEEANLYFLHTRRLQQERTQKPIAFDRVQYFSTDQTLKDFSGEQIHVEGATPMRSGRVSFRGIFIAPDTFLSKEYHYHLDQRDFASETGLIMACALLIQSLLLPLMRRLFTFQGQHK